MKLIHRADELISNLKTVFHDTSKISYPNEEPFRAELFTAAQMETFGKTLAGIHKLSTKPAKEHLLKRLANNEVVLQEVRKLIADSIRKKYQITPAGEWLIDNFYLIEEHIRNAKIHFPKDYSEDLPQLVNGSTTGLTRIYSIVLEIISHSDGRIDIESLGGFITSYQSVTHLKLGELWAIPIMLRLALIENLRRVAARIAIDRVDGNLADYWAGQMIETAENSPKNLILIIADMARSNPPMVSAFVSELTRQLRGKGPELALSLNWVEQQLADNGSTSAELINAEIQKQAANQLSMSNSIGSLRLLSSMDWRNFVETHSIVEQTLHKDKTGIYELMDFATRDRYRHVVENLAKRSACSEYEVAQIAVNLATDNFATPSEEQRKAHVGYYLIGKGIIQTKNLVKVKESWKKRIQIALHKHALKIYIGAILIITFSLSALALYKTFTDTGNYWLFWLIGFLSLICTSQLAISLINFVCTLVVRPRLLPRMDYSKGVAPESRTLVAVPVMLSGKDEIEKLVENLEVHFLANRDAHLHFGLLTDFEDADAEHLPQDQSLLNLAQKRIEELNRKYHRSNNDLFYLFHRPRHWNANENAWMGYERKRGKLSELNSLLRGNARERFSLIIGDQSIFPTVKYVITLDADTQLPMGSAWKLIGTMAHPLNRAGYDHHKKLVTEGYGILQPRVMVSLPERSDSPYARMNGNEPGIDPYTRASSDVYQDLFGEGSFIGKGIYDVDIFKNVLEGRFTENGILSHDLLEGCYVRSGLLSDVQLFEKYPTTYKADIKRRLRWTRGDWQILPWCTPFVPDVDRTLRKNPISALSRWKIFDNIRRSLVPVALTTLLLAGWLMLPSSLFWTIAVSLVIVVPIAATSLWDALHKPKDIVLMEHLKNSVVGISEIFLKTMFSLICLPYEAIMNLLAIARTMWRMLVSRRKLLEWNPSAKDTFIKQTSISAYFMTMSSEPVLALLVIAGLGIFDSVNLLVALPILILWLVAPFITWWASQPREKQAAQLSKEQLTFLRKSARKTWSFFEHFVGIEDNWLPPDNFQEQPITLLAHRTSPTNIGLALLSNVTAHEFGFITLQDLLTRTKNTLQTLSKMDRYRGHFFNWYDTETLQPLTPKYISTVDSGNLAAHLIVLKQGLLNLYIKPISHLKYLNGLQDTFHVFRDLLNEQEIQHYSDFSKSLDELVAVESPLYSFPLKQLKILLNQFTRVPNTYVNHEQKKWWHEKICEQLQSKINELAFYSPWIEFEKVPEKYIDLIKWNENDGLVKMVKHARKIQLVISEQTLTAPTKDESDWLNSTMTALSAFINHAEEQISMAKILAKQCEEFAEMDWDFLYDKFTNLFTIGFNVQEHKIDSGSYDLLASEARLCTYMAIAQGKLPEESWFALGRLLTNVGGDPVLLSWSGSMFEYLMPLLVMPNYENTLLDQTYKSAVNWQIKYGKQTGVPWGISESGFNMINASSHYQYRAFGAPGLGLKRGLEEDSVIAPYASTLALMVDPESACANLELLSKKGMEGKYGFYEALDYTPSRLPRGQTSSLIYSFMAHHQGMSLLAYAYLLLDKPLQKLFEAEPQFKAALLLLQERIPKASVFFAHTTDIAEINYITDTVEARIINTPNTVIPEIQLLSNGKYHLMITNSGGGYSRWKELSLTRWMEDGTCDNRGTFWYIRDVKTGEFWSNTFQPTLKKATKYEAAFSQGRVDFHSSINEIEAHTEIVVSPEDDMEMRRIQLTNRSDIRKTLELTSYSEVVLSLAASDSMQPAFSNLFVQTEIIPEQHAIFCTRRPRSAEEQIPWLFHQVTLFGKNSLEISYETDRMEFIGRGNSTFDPNAMKLSGPLSGKQGSVLDPIVAVRYKFTLDPDEAVSLDMLTGIAETREGCLNLVNKYHDKHHKDRVFELAWTHSQVVLRQINASEADAQLYGSLAGSVLFMNSAFRADANILINNQRGQSGLWGYSISGDLPIVLLKIEKQENLQLVKQMIQAHAYWRLKGLAVDLVIWNEEHSGYRQVFQSEIQAMVPSELADRPGGIFVRASDQISNEDRILFQTVARINLSDSGGSLADAVKRKPLAKISIPYIVPEQKYAVIPSLLTKPENLLFFNGIGGFSKDGNEYFIELNQNQKTPAPWVNVIANRNFGTVVSESGSAYTWFENAHELRLTPWSNDPVSDSGGEVVYIRDEESGKYWSTTLLPKGSDSPYITRHGFGYSVFEHTQDGIHTQMTVFVDLKSAIKFTVLKIKNHSGRFRKLSATGYNEWVMGDHRMKTAMHIHTEVDPLSGALFAKNPYHPEFPGRVGFYDVDFSKKTFTCDRTEFIGRNRSLKNPDGMLRTKLSGRAGLALDSCAAVQIPFELADGAEQEIIFRLGAAKDTAEASVLALQFRGNSIAHEALEDVKKYWTHTVGAIKVETPDIAVNLITNGWLIYQVLSSRIWGRSGFYQSGGAFGFRDQLQDVLAVLHVAPEIAREQILLSASRQFVEGDVQHWWHPPFGRGVRTRCSDDYLWLPYVTSNYIKHTGDYTILQSKINYLEGRQLNFGEESYYDLPIQSLKVGTLYEHCVKAIQYGLNYGVHGLPLIGAGDWNDGFDRVGKEGKGESVWLGFFLYEILRNFTELSEYSKDTAFTEICIQEAIQLRQNIDDGAWDGEWYKRAWMDDGTPLGASQNEECRIDSIAQSWSVISGAGEKDKAKKALNSAYKYLVRKDSNIIQLLDPPFDTSDLNPGYIKGYVPGVRENGGQYTHAAIWMIIAFAKLGENAKVWELLQMINPVNHGKSAQEISVYKVEPYVLAADVYAREPHAGRGGWTWYTGSAAWMFRLLTEYFLGLKQEGDLLKLNPCIPPDWKSFQLSYRYKSTVYELHFIRGIHPDNCLLVDGILQSEAIIKLVDDGQVHQVEYSVKNTSQNQLAS